MLLNSFRKILMTHILSYMQYLDSQTRSLSTDLALKSLPKEELTSRAKSTL